MMELFELSGHWMESLAKTLVHSLWIGLLLFLAADRLSLFFEGSWVRTNLHLVPISSAHCTIQSARSANSAWNWSRPAVMLSPLPSSQ